MPHLPKEVNDRHVLVAKIRLVEVVFYLDGLVFFQGKNQVFQVEDSYNVVDVFPVDGDPRKVVFLDKVKELLVAALDVQGGYGGPRGHNGQGLVFLDVQNIVDKGCFFVHEDALLF